MPRGCTLSLAEDGDGRERPAPGCGVAGSSPGAHWDVIQIVLKNGSALALAEHMQREVRVFSLPAHLRVAPRFGSL